MATTLYHANQYVSTILATAGGIDDSQTTDIELQSVTGIDTTKPGIACVSYSSPIDTDNAEWIAYTSINSSTKKLEGVTRGAEGFSAKSHAYGVTVAFPISESHINNLATALSINGDATDGVTSTIDDDSMATASATTLATSESIKAYVDNGTLSSKIITATRDLTAASADVSYTGVGFKPTAIICFVNIDGSANASLGIGVCDSSKTDYTVGQYDGGFLYQGTAFITVESASAQTQIATVKSFDNDGFTLTWTKNNNPTGTAKIIFLCFR